MLLDNPFNPMVFEVSNDKFELLGEINQFNSLSWPTLYNEVSTFELWASNTPENQIYFREGNIIWCGGINAAVIENIKSNVDDNQTISYNVKGRTLEALLKSRVLSGDTYIKEDYPSTIMYDIVTQNCINPVDNKRKIPYLECAPDTHVGNKILYQKTGGYVYDSIENISKGQELGFRINFKPNEKKMVFEVFKGLDRSWDQQINDSVQFSTDVDDILTSSYYFNSQDFKNVVFVSGEDSGTSRKKIVTGEVDSVGLNRNELFVDARDLQSRYTDDSGMEHELTEQEYLDTLKQRGIEKISDNQIAESFEAKLRVIGEVQYVYGEDYFIGDIVTVRDDLLGVTVTGRVTEVEEVWDDIYSVNITFGYSYPTITKKIRRDKT